MPRHDGIGSANLGRGLQIRDHQKRRVVFDTGHNIPRPDLIRESLD
jgi:hypothetical protein